MWKQYFGKLSRKTSKSDAHSDSASNNHHSNNGSCNGNSIQRTSSGSPSAAANRTANPKKTSSAVFPSSVVAGIEPLLSFKDVTSQEKPNLFISKLNFCSVVFDFYDPNKNSTEKDMKRQALIDLIDYVNMGPARFTEQIISASCKMFAANLFRVFPPNYRSNSSGGGEAEEEEPMFDPAWSHLQLVYDLMLKFVGSTSLDAKVGKKYFDHSFIFRLLELFDSEDPRERDCLKTILHKIYGKFMVHRPFIRKSVSNIFYRFAFETERHNGIGELLEVFGSVISGFAVPLKEEHKIFLWKALIPLHKPKSVGSYLQQLTYCVTQFIEKDPKLASTVVGGLLKYWPVTNSQKEVLFLSELEEVLEAVDAAEFQKCAVPLFRRIGYCLNSSHFQVAERALFFWNNERIIGMVAQNRQAIMPLLVPAIERNCKDHWNQAVLNLTLNARKLLSEMDEELYSACRRKHEETEEERALVDERRRARWERLEAAASFKPVTGNTAVLVKRPFPVSPEAATFS